MHQVRQLNQFHREENRIPRPVSTDGRVDRDPDDGDPINLQRLEQSSRQHSRDLPGLDRHRRDIDRGHVQVGVHGCQEANAKQLERRQDQGVPRCTQNHQIDAGGDRRFLGDTRQSRL